MIGIISKLLAIALIMTVAAYKILMAYVYATPNNWDNYFLVPSGQGISGYAITIAILIFFIAMALSMILLTNFCEEISCAKIILTGAIWLGLGNAIVAMRQEQLNIAAEAMKYVTGTIQTPTGAFYSKYEYALVVAGQYYQSWEAALISIGSLAIGIMICFLIPYFFRGIRKRQPA